MKKLFSYLLISSMVILSSCTNYDDQFDDLNTQINSLKSQIEGFSSLSSGLTSLQGTVASLQAAVAALPKTATPATDISGLEAAVAALQTAISGAATAAEVAALTADLAATQAALEASIAAASTPATDISGLEATVAELKTSLAAASTSAEITALTAELAAAEVALTAAVAANATAVAGNTTDIAALATSLEALTATIAELQASLATVSTTAEVDALAASLAAAQADLTAIIASSNFYEADLTVNTVATLDFATQLGNKVQFLSKGLTITQTEDMDVDKLTALMSKVRNVSGAVIYSSSATTTTKASFVNLTGAGSMTFTQDGDISLPSLQTVGALSITGSLNTKTVSLPKLTSATAAMSFNALTKATTFSMPVMVNHDFPITVTIDKAGSIDLSAFTNATAYDGSAGGGQALTVTAGTLTAPVYAKGVITGNEITSVSLPKWTGADGSVFADATTVVLPSLDNLKAASYDIDIAVDFPKATSVHLIAAASTATTPDHLNVSTGGSTKLETLILGGTWDDVTVNGSDVTSFTFDGSAQDVTVNATDIETLDIPYTALAKGSLSITANTDLASVTASKVNGLKGLTVTGNTELTSISFAALKTSSAGASVDISGNELVIENVQQASAVAPIVAKKITSADFAPLKTFIDAAIAAATATVGSGVKVIADDVLQSTSAAGVVTDQPSGDHTIVNYDLNIKSDAKSTGAVARVNEFEVGASADLTVNGFVSSVVGNGSALIYELEKWASDAANVAGFTTAGVTVSVGKGNFVGSINHDAAISTAATDYYELTINGSTVTGTTGALGDGDAAQVAYMAAVNAALAKKANAEFTVAVDGSDASKTNFTGGRKGSNAAAFTIANWKVWENVSKLTPVAMTATIVAANQPNTTGYIRVVSNDPGTDGAITSTYTNLTPIAISGPNTAASATLDDGASVVEKNGTSTASTVSAETIAAARIDMTAFL